MDRVEMVVRTEESATEARLASGESSREEHPRRSSTQTGRGGAQAKARGDREMVQEGMRQ